MVVTHRTNGNHSGPSAKKLSTKPIGSKTNSLTNYNTKDDRIGITISHDKIIHAFNPTGAAWFYAWQVLYNIDVHY